MSRLELQLQLHAVKAEAAAKQDALQADGVAAYAHIDAVVAERDAACARELILKRQLVENKENAKREHASLARKEASRAKRLKEVEILNAKLGDSHDADMVALTLKLNEAEAAARKAKEGKPRARVIVDDIGAKFAVDELGELYTDGHDELGKIHDEMRVMLGQSSDEALKAKPSRKPASSKRKFVTDEVEEQHKMQPSDVAEPSDSEEEDDDNDDDNHD